MKNSLILLLTAVVLFTSSCDFPIAVQTANSPVDVLRDPVQKVPGSAGKIPINFDDGYIVLTPKAHYDISAQVESKKKYTPFFGGWTAEISRYDLALSWGEITKAEHREYISYSQKGRWYYFHYSADSKYKSGYIYKHSANTHIIHANDNILSAVKSIDEGDHVRLKGYLVYADGSVNGGNVWWHSSLSRNDTGDGSCEVFYVTSVQLGDQIFE